MIGSCRLVGGGLGGGRYLRIGIEGLGGWEGRQGV